MIVPAVGFLQRPLSLRVIRGSKLHMGSFSLEQNFVYSYILSFLNDKIIQELFDFLYSLRILLPISTLYKLLHEPTFTSYFFKKRKKIESTSLLHVTEVKQRDVFNKSDQPLLPNLLLSKLEHSSTTLTSSITKTAKAKNQDR